MFSVKNQSSLAKENQAIPRLFPLCRKDISKNPFRNAPP
jgi:hypothetical protein